MNSSSNRNLEDIRRTHEQVDIGQMEYDREFAPLCRLLNISPAQLAGLPASVVVSLFDIRIFRILSLKMREIDDKVKTYQSIITQLEDRLRREAASTSTPSATPTVEDGATQEK